MTDSTVTEVLQHNQRLLDCIAAGDWETYRELCDPSLTAFEPEAKGQLVEGLPFHHFYFKLGGAKAPYNTTMCSPNVRVIGEVAIVAYVRVNQRIDAAGNPTTSAVEETRVWQRKNGRWVHIHFHRSVC